MASRASQPDFQESNKMTIDEVTDEQMQTIAVTPSHSSIAQEKKKYNLPYPRISRKMKYILLILAIIIIGFVISHNQSKDYLKQLREDTTTTIKVDKNKEKADNHQEIVIKQPNLEKVSAKSTPLQSQAMWPTDMSDYNMDDSFNLWDISPQEKVALLKKYKELPEGKKPKMTQNYSQINYDSEVFLKHSQKFEAESEVLNWGAIELTQQQKNKMASDFDLALKQRRKKFQNIIKEQKQFYKGKNGFLDKKKQITYRQFLAGLEELQLVGENMNSNEELKNIYEREKKYFQSKYKVKDYSKELHACLVSPTYKNNQDFRYAWHIQSIMQQDYSNFRVIIVDDASPDNTGGVLAKYLKWRDFPRDKIILIRNKVHKTAMENFYYAVHKYCDFNQMFFVVDGDDQLPGTQVFRLYNALYQQKKLYTLYSNYYSYRNRNPRAPVILGISMSYDEKAKTTNNYKGAPHAYSHLRSMMSDLFLFTNVDSFKDWNGKFYWAIPDDAQYFPALEMSCGRVHYVSELKYWYRGNLQTNESNSPLEELNKVYRHIRQKQKKYHCINNVFEVIRSTLKSEGKLSR